MTTEFAPPHDSQPISERDPATVAPGGAGAAPTWRRVLAQGAFETRTLFRNGEQLLVTLFLPALLLVGMAQVEAFEIETNGAARIDVVTPGVLALAVMSSAFASQAIATAFDRRNGVLRMLATTPLGRSGLLAGKIVAVLAVEAVQLIVLSTLGLVLGWRPDPAGIPGAILAVVLGAAAFAGLALFLAGTLRAEAVIAVANLVLVVLAVAGGILVPVTQLPGPLADIAPWLPSGALGEAMRGSLLDGSFPGAAFAVLAAWTVVFSWGAVRLFRWRD